MFIIGPQEYPTNDPRYIIEPKRTVRHACDTPHLVCIQPHKKHRSNLVVVLLMLEQLGEPQGVVDLTQTLEGLAIELSSDNGPSNFVDDHEETNPEVLEWPATQKKEKMSYKATRKF
jgi:hypothetical protein